MHHSLGGPFQWLLVCVCSTQIMMKLCMKVRLNEARRLVPPTSIMQGTSTKERWEICMGRREGEAGKIQIRT